MINRVAAAAAAASGAEDMIGKDVFGFLHGEQREAARKHLAAAEAVETCVNLPVEFRITVADGRERRFEATTTPIVLADGPALFTMLRDVTRAREASAALAAAKEQAESSNRAKSQFLANMSHEIRTPLNDVLGMADLLRGTPLSAEQRRYCEAIAASARSLRDLLDGVLDLAKIEAGKMDLEHEEFDLSRLVQDLVSIYRELAGAAKTEFVASVELPAGSRYIGDSLRVRQVLGNLLGNAVKFTEGGKIEFEVRPREPRNGDARKWILFTVKDSGIGMDEQARAKLFQPFTQADTSTTRRFGGTGLGLAIARNLVDLMGGTLEVQSAPGAGSTFSVSLPFDGAEASIDESRAPWELSGTRGAAASLRSQSVLLIEDNEINQEVARTVLEQAGHRVQVAGDGAEGVHKWARGRFDCVLMDCLMPVMDGYEATREIRAREARRGAGHVRIISLTASNMAEDRARCLAAGMDDFLSKPFESASLLALVEGHSVRPEAKPLVASSPASCDPAALAVLLKLDRKQPGFLGKLIAIFAHRPGHRAGGPDARRVRARQADADRAPGRLQVRTQGRHFLNRGPASAVAARGAPPKALRRHRVGEPRLHGQRLRFQTAGEQLGHQRAPQDAARAVREGAMDCLETGKRAYQRQAVRRHGTKSDPPFKRGRFEAGFGPRKDSRESFEVAGMAVGPWRWVGVVDVETRAGHRESVN